MDERLKKALDISNYMVTLNNQKRMLKEKYYENLVYYHNGGQFTVTKELVSFCFALQTAGQEVTILIDDNDIPIEIVDLESFLSEVTSKYFESANEFLAEYNKLKTSRSVESIMELWVKKV